MDQRPRGQWVPQVRRRHNSPHLLRHYLIVALALYALGAPLHGQETWRQEADRLAALLRWHPGSVVAEIGAGNGKLTLEAAHRVAPSGKLYTNEIDADALRHLKELAAKEKNITVIEGAAANTNLPAACCDSMFMRLVYHHLTKPAEIDASLLRALKPEGRLAVIDEEPREGSEIPEGVPKNRVGHGIPQKILISELAAAGFEVETATNDWPSRDGTSFTKCIASFSVSPAADAAISLCRSF